MIADHCPRNLNLDIAVDDDNVPVDGEVESVHHRDVLAGYIVG